MCVIARCNVVNHQFGDIDNCEKSVIEIYNPFKNKRDKFHLLNNTFYLEGKVTDLQQLEKSLENHKSTLYRSIRWGAVLLTAAGVAAFVTGVLLGNEKLWEAGLSISIISSTGVPLVYYTNVDLFGERDCYFLAGGFCGFVPNFFLSPYYAYKCESIAEKSVATLRDSVEKIQNFVDKYNNELKTLFERIRGEIKAEMETATEDLRKKTPYQLGEISKKIRVAANQLVNIEWFLANLQKSKTAAETRASPVEAS